MITSSGSSSFGSAETELSPEASAVLEGGAEWVNWAKVLLPEFVDLSNPDVCDGFFAEFGIAQGFIWDLLAAMRADVSPELAQRVFEFIVRCVRSNDPQLHNPAAIGFLCKVALPERGVIDLDELANHLPTDVLDDLAELFVLHYGKSGLSDLRAAKSGKRRH